MTQLLFTVEVLVQRPPADQPSDQPAFNDTFEVCYLQLVKQFGPLDATVLLAGVGVRRATGALFRIIGARMIGDPDHTAVAPTQGESA